MPRGDCDPRVTSLVGVQSLSPSFSTLGISDGAERRPLQAVRRHPHGSANSLFTCVHEDCSMPTEHPGGPNASNTHGIGAMLPRQKSV